MQIHLDLSYADAKVLRAFAQFVTASAEAAEERQAAAETEKRLWLARGGAQEIAPRYYAASEGQAAQAAGTSPFVDAGDGTVTIHPDAKVTVSTFGEAKGPEKKPRAKKVVEPAKQEAEETCLDVKPSAEAQQELPLQQAAKVPEPQQAANEPAPTIDDLRRHLRAYGQASGAEALSSLYAEYGAKQLSDLPADKYAEIIAKVSA